MCDREFYPVIMPFGDVCKQPRATSSGRCGALRKALREVELLPECHGVAANEGHLLAELSQTIRRRLLGLVQPYSYPRIHVLRRVELRYESFRCASTRGATLTSVANALTFNTYN